MHRVLALTLAAIGLAAWAEPAAVKHNVLTDLKPWTHLNLNNDAENFQFVIVTDRTGGHRPGVFMDGVRKINLLQPEFVMSVGDLIEGYTEDLDKLDREWTEFIGFVDQLQMPFFYVPGNHDISNPVMVEEWKKRFGSLYYHFVYRDVLFLCLDTEDPPNTQMSDAQVAYVKRALAENPDVRWTLLFLHKPLWNYDADNGWKEVEEALQGRKYNVFAGHTHHYFKTQRQDANYIVLATMGGGSRLRGPEFGEFDHFMWVTMTDGGPLIANLMLDGIWDTEVVTPERAELVKPALSGSLVRTDGIVVDQPEVEEVGTVLRLTNDADIPLQLQIRIGNTDLLRPSLLSLSRTVPPNSVEQIDLTLTADEPAAVDDLRPVQVNWTALYEPEGDLQPVRIRGQHRIVIDSMFSLASTQKDITVDGDLSDWDELPIAVPEPGQVITTQDAWHGRLDGSWRFGIVRKGDYVYIGIDVEDDEFRSYRKPDYQRQDSVELRLDGRPAAERDAGPYSDNKDVLFAAIIPGQVTADLPMKDQLPEGTQIVCKHKERGGYTVEAAIPAAYLAGLQEDGWKALRLNISFNDHDADGYAQLNWRPLWTSPANYQGSGLFEK